jgi:hypothetical protein
MLVAPDEFKHCFSEFIPTAHPAKDSIFAANAPWRICIRAKFTVAQHFAATLA